MIPKLKIADLTKLDLDHRAGFVLSQIDGATSIGDLVALCGLPEEELYGIIGILFEYEALSFEH